MITLPGQPLVQQLIFQRCTTQQSGDDGQAGAGSPALCSLLHLPASQLRTCRADSWQVQIDVKGRNSALPFRGQGAPRAPQTQRRFGHPPIH
jgi:hypothetical protein